MNDWLLPTIDPALCDGCGRCVLTCPVGALAIQDGLAAIVHPEACTYTAECEAACPTAAIALPYDVVLASDNGEGSQG